MNPSSLEHMKWSQIWWTDQEPCVPGWGDGDSADAWTCWADNTGSAASGGTYNRRNYGRFMRFIGWNPHRKMNTKKLSIFVRFPRVLGNHQLGFRIPTFNCPHAKARNELIALNQRQRSESSASTEVGAMLDFGLSLVHGVLGYRIF